MSAYRIEYVLAKSEADARHIAERTPHACYGDRRQADLDCQFANGMNGAGVRSFKVYEVHTAVPSQKIERVSLVDLAACFVLMFGGVGVVPVALWMMGA